MKTRPTGVIPPMTTPFRRDGEIDLKLVAPQVDWLIGAGAHGMAAGGSTGEGHTLDHEEYRDLMAATVQAARGRAPVIAGIIVDTTRDAIRRGKLVRDMDVAALQMAPDKLIYGAVDALMYPSYALGAHGSIAAILSAAPHASVALWDAVKKGDHAQALELHKKLLTLWNAIVSDNLPACTRHAQFLQGLPKTYSRAPMPEASPAQAAAVAKALEGLGALGGKRVEAAE
jgi:dihydrodipicolinate synthase/N-acetylneuraminate lyase